MLKTAAYLRTHAFRVSEHLRENKEAGATATEYGLLVAFIAFTVVAGAIIFGDAMEAWFTRLGAEIDTWAPDGAPAGP